MSYNPLNLETAVRNDKVMQDFESESFTDRGRHSLVVKAPPIRNGSGLKDCVNLSFPNAVSRLNPEGILLVNKPAKITSFRLVAILRKILGIKKIGHAGTLDPFATGVMVMLIGRQYTKLSDKLLTADKEYSASVFLGCSTDTYDCEGIPLQKSSLIPTDEDIKKVISYFQGEIEQVPPMYSAKKVNGKKLYELARKGETIERKPCKVTLETKILNYHYPYLELHVKCTKGTYIRSIAHDIGNMLGCFAHLSRLQRTASGQFLLKDCIDGKLLNTVTAADLRVHLKTLCTSSNNLVA